MHAGYFIFGWTDGSLDMVGDCTVVFLEAGQEAWFEFEREISIGQPFLCLESTNVLYYPASHITVPLRVFLHKPLPPLGPPPV